MKVTMYAYDLFTRRINGKGFKNVDIFEDDIIEVLNDLLSKDLVNRRYEIKKSNKIIYLLGMEYDKDTRIALLKFGSAKYNSVRDVLNTDTMRQNPKKKKTKKDGDEEKTCMVIRFTEGEEGNWAKCLVQVNSNGVSISKIMEYINNSIIEYHEKKKCDNIRYHILYSNIVSNDFLNSLEKAGRIKTVKLVMDSEEVDTTEFRDFSQKKDLRKEFDIVLKPATKGASILGNTVRDFFKDYNSSKKIKRIYVDSDTADGNPLSFDTEKMKERVIVSVQENVVTGEPNINELNIIMKQKVLAY